MAKLETIASNEPPKSGNAAVSGRVPMISHLSDRLKSVSAGAQASRLKSRPPQPPPADGASFTSVRRRPSPLPKSNSACGTPFGKALEQHGFAFGPMRDRVRQRPGYEARGQLNATD